MRYRALANDGDYMLGKSVAQEFLVNSPQTVAQAVLTRLKLFTGEWFLDTTEGTPWNSQVLGKNTQPFYDIAIKERVLDTEGVTKITAYQSLLDTVSRRLTVTLTIDTLYGETAVNTAFGPRPLLTGQLDSTFILDESVLA